MICTGKTKNCKKIANSNAKKVRAEFYRVNVTNTVDMVGDDVVLAFITSPKISINDPSPPIKQLFGFERIHLDVNESTQVFFLLNVQSLLTIGEDGSKWLEPDSYQILIGQKHMFTIHLDGQPT